MADRSYLVAGLGNIGAEYSGTRHNIGFIVLDAWAQASNITFETRRYGDVAVDSFKGRSFYLLKPSTYMNLSGNAIRYWLQELEIPLENLIVVCDDFNLPFGTTRMRMSGSTGGHNGLENIEELLETRQYARVRVGIGHEFSEGSQIDFVLSGFSPEQVPELPHIADRVIAGIKTWAFVGGQKAMTELNTRTEKTDNAPSQ
ncbi:MAG: aminoacyl-tRNA hydrolase [Bacteroidales bacterium]|nr:aminoacyl-tRNA hydrolase [Bacteroidales bacterium]